MNLHILHKFQCVPSSSKEDIGYFIYKNLWHILGTTKTEKVIPRKYWEWTIRKNGSLPGCTIFYSWPNHPDVTFDSSEYILENLSGRGEWLVFGVYDCVDEIEKNKSLGELYIHGLSDSDGSNEEILKLRENHPFSSVYIGDNVALVKWKVFSKIKIPPEIKKSRSKK